MWNLYIFPWVDTEKKKTVVCYSLEVESCILVHWFSNWLKLEQK